MLLLQPNDPQTKEIISRKQHKCKQTFEYLERIFLTFDEFGERMLFQSGFSKNKTVN